MEPIIRRFVSTLYDENTYVITLDDKAIVIDPGSSYNEVLNYIRENNLDLIALLATHAHIDHVYGVPYIKSVYDVPFYLSKEDLYVLEHTNRHYKIYIGDMEFIEVPYPDKYVSEGVLWIKPFKLRIIETPGHTLGSISYLYNKYLFTGDTIFRETIGRTDFGGDTELLVKSIHSKIFKLSGDTVIYPGHGEESTVGYEIRHNVYVGVNGIYPYEIGDSQPQLH